MAAVGTGGVSLAWRVLGDVARSVRGAVRRNRKRSALRILFENTDAAPFLVDAYDSRAGGPWRCYRVGLVNVGDERLDHARVIVEECDYGKGRRVRLDQRLRQSNDHKDSTSVLPKTSAAPVMFDIVEQWHDGRDPSDYAWFCYADAEPKGGEMLPFGKSRLVLRAEADGATPARLTLYAQTRTPRGHTLAGEVDVRRTHLLVRREG
jgi:hypothetical protein